MPKVSPSDDLGIHNLVLDPKKLAEVEATIEATKPDDNLAHLRRYVDSKCCYDGTPLREAIVKESYNRVAYQIEMWSLMEKRWTTWSEKPYRQEPVPNVGVENLFTAYYFPAPHTIVKTKIESSETLPNTQRVISCPDCSGNGTTGCYSCSGKGRRTCWSCSGSGNRSDGRRCSSCNGSGSSLCSTCHGSMKVPCRRCATVGRLLRWAVIHARWHTEQSIGCISNTFLPHDEIKKANGKVMILPKPNTENVDKDGFPWASSDNCKTWTRHPTLENYQGLYSLLTQEEMDFKNHINEHYVKFHFQQLTQDMHIRRLKIEIQKLSIKEYDYTIGNYLNKNPKKGKKLDRKSVV